MDDLAIAILNAKPKVAVTDHDNMQLFWQFITERQNIFKKRYIDKLPDPWTHDQILRDYKFTNVYRELDRGTIFYLDNIVPIAEELGATASEEEGWMALLFYTFVYRHFNHIPTWQAIYPDLSKRNFRAVEKKLQELPQVYTNAHNVTGFQWAGSVSKVVNSMYLIQDLWYEKLEEIALALRHRNDDMGASWEYMYKYVGGLGGFTAYEVVVDLSYTDFTTYTEDDWVNPGPGCRRGLNRLFPDLGNNLEACRAKIHELRANQREYFSRYGLQFYFWRDRELTLRNIEHSLCEFSKYMKAYNDEGRPRNNFTPCEWNRELEYVE